MYDWLIGESENRRESGWGNSGEVNEVIARQMGMAGCGKQGKSLRASGGVVKKEQRDRL